MHPLIYQAEHQVSAILPKNSPGFCSDSVQIPFSQVIVSMNKHISAKKNLPYIVNPKSAPMALGAETGCNKM